MSRARTQGDRGFTLVEILVVVGILALLAALIFPAVSFAQRRSREKAAAARIEQLKLALSAYEADFGDYPPTSLAAPGLATNGTNEGIEALVRCLTTRRERGPYATFEDKELANTDEDSLLRDPCDSTIASKELFELVDPWGNPYIYYHNRDYRGGAKLERYILANGERAICKPHPNPKTGQYPAVSSFMIWSVGANGVNEDGEGDDIASWK
jgi:prepilin-type N-terminal cleavage/methylation domain-containing protein